MQNTANYQLPTWEQDDQIKMSDFNALTARLDAALKQSADALASEVTAREAADSAKADAAAVAALTAAVGAGGHNCRVASGSYTGTGTNLVSLATPFRPVLLLLQADGSSAVQSYLRLSDVTTYQQEFGVTDCYLKLTWAADGVSWCTTASLATAKQAERCGNISGKTYHYLVLGCAD